MQIAFLPWTAWVRMAVWLLAVDVIQTVSADDSSSSSINTDSPFTITWVDIVFVVLTVGCELYGYYEIRRFIKASGIRDIHGNDVSAQSIKLSTVATGINVVCQIVKLYPPPYFCTTSSCSKVVHNSVMTLVCFVGDILECSLLGTKALQDPVPSRLHLCFKIIQIVASFGYIVYDAGQDPAPGPGSTVLVVLACLAEVLVFSLESIVLYKATYNTLDSTGINVVSRNQEMPEP